MPIYITDKDSVPHYAATSIDHIISIGCVEDMPDVRAFRQQNLTLHRFVFEDVASAHLDHVIPPSSDIMKRLMKVFDGVEGANTSVLFHCAAGRSRSTAAAFIYLVRRGLGYQEAYQEVERVRGVIQPNMLMIKLADELMDRKGEMLRFVAVASGRPDYRFE